MNDLLETPLAERSHEDVHVIVHDDVGEELVALSIEVPQGPDDDVSLALTISVTNISGSGFNGLPTFGNREIKTVIRLREGETNMLAGLIRDDERTTLAGIPGLSDIPVVGKLFAHSTKTTDQTDIILTLTPHIIRVLDLTEADLRPFRVGRDSIAPIAELPVIEPPRPEPPKQEPPPPKKPGGS